MRTYRIVWFSALGLAFASVVLLVTQTGGRLAFVGLVIAASTAAIGFAIRARDPHSRLEDLGR